MLKALIKYFLSFIVNLLIFVTIYFVVPQISNTELNRSINNLLYLGIVFSISYSSIYFINDYSDMEEDRLNKPYNLALSIKNKRIYWSLYIIIFILSGFLLSRISIWPAIVLIIVNLYQVLYSIYPRIKDNNYLFAFGLAFFYPAKILLIMLILNIKEIANLFGELVVLFFIISLAAIYYKGVAKKKKRNIPLPVIIFAIFGAIGSILILKPSYLLYITILFLIIVGRGLVYLATLFIKASEGY